MTDVPHIPVLRAGVEYESLDQNDLVSHRDGRLLAKVSQANAGIVSRDLRRIADKTSEFRSLSTARRLEICKEAGKHFLESTLPLNEAGATQSPQDYVDVLSETSGLPHSLCRRNMHKVWTVFDEMPTILRGLTRGMDPSVIDGGFGEHSGIPVYYAPTTDALGVVLPSNSPGVNSIWMPAIALGVPVVLKPGREEPWTPLRIIQAFVAAGMPREAFSCYPTDHEGSARILEVCGRSLLFGDEGVTKTYAKDPRVNIHGPGRSKILIGADVVDDWRDFLDVLVASVADNGGRSCINASSIFVPAHGEEIAEAIAQRLAEIELKPHDDEDAKLSAFANPKFAEWIDAKIDEGLAEGGAVDVTAQHRDGPRARELGGSQYLMPTLVRCDSPEHALAKTEFLFPFVSVVEVPEERMLDEIGPSLVVTGVTKSPDFAEALRRSPDINRLNLGPLPTSRVDWDQPHEGNLFEFLYERRAIQRAPGW